LLVRGGRPVAGFLPGAIDHGHLAGECAGRGSGWIDRLPPEALSETKRDRRSMIRKSV